MRAKCQFSPSGRESAIYTPQAVSLNKHLQMRKTPLVRRDVGAGESLLFRGVDAGVFCRYGDVTLF